MGFFETLDKVLDVTTDFLIKFGKHQERHIGRMTDEEIEKRYSKPAELVRAEAEISGYRAEMLEMRKEMEKEMRNGMRKEKTLGERDEEIMNNKKNGVYDNDY